MTRLSTDWGSLNTCVSSIMCIPEPRTTALWIQPSADVEWTKVRTQQCHLLSVPHRRPNGNISGISHQQWSLRTLGAPGQRGRSYWAETSQ